MLALLAKLNMYRVSAMTLLLTAPVALMPSREDQPLLEDLAAKEGLIHNMLVVNAVSFDGEPCQRNPSDLIEHLAKHSSDDISACDMGSLEAAAHSASMDVVPDACEKRQHEAAVTLESNTSLARSSVSVTELPIASVHTSDPVASESRQHSTGSYSNAESGATDVHLGSFTGDADIAAPGLQGKDAYEMLSRVWKDLLASCIAHPSTILSCVPTYSMFAESFPTLEAIRRFQACQSLQDIASQNTEKEELLHGIIIRTAILLLQRQADQVSASTISELTTLLQSASEKALVSTQALLYCRNLLRLVYGTHQRISDPSFLKHLETRKRHAKR
eukprot:TRINITY_DN18069_c0_g1_i1.p1 TRINITY_DN18069_c0_g1~~TRINITY_DN18069_c0_g1_i1.p1  ORF type:complete len:332 (-),score=43.95 TRINITY_DN18069_c0_g1_i1:13-1008(-)